jgi:hypothetical protein
LTTDAPNKKEPDEWVSGDDPMTASQASYLKTLSEEAADPDAYDENLTKAEASKRIDALSRRSLAQDVRRKAKTVVKAGYGDKGDQKRK